MAINIRESNLVPFSIQIGDGIPIHLSPIGTIYFDRLGEIMYQNKDGLDRWDNFAYGSTSGGTGTDTYVTGFTYSNNVLTIKQNQEATDLSLLIGMMTGLTVTGIFSATTYQGLPTDVYTTGGTYSNGTTTLYNSTGGTFSVAGFYTGSTDVRVTGSTYSNNNFTFTNNTGGTFSVLFNTVSGLTSSGNIIANTISATTYQNLPTDIRVTGGTYSNGSATFTNNTGGTFSVNGFTTSFTGGTVNGLTATTISATTYQGMQDVKVTGGTYNSTTGIATYTNNTGGTFTVNGFYTGTTLNFITTADSTPSVSGVTLNTYAQSVSVPPNSFGTGDVVELRSRARKTGVAGTLQLRFYVCTGQTLSGAVLLGTSTAAAAGSLYSQFSRTIVIKDATGNTETYPVATNAINDDGAANGTTQANVINWSIPQFIIVAIQNGSAGDSSVITFIKASKFRQ